LVVGQVNKFNERLSVNVSIEWLLVGRDNVNVANSGNKVQQNELKETSRSILVSVGLVMDGVGMTTNSAMAVWEGKE
jgi:hypothetical protein